MAYSIGYDLVIADSEYEELDKKLSEYSDDFEDDLSMFCSILERLRDSGFEEGEFHDNFSVFVENVCKLKGTVKEIGNSGCKCCEDFVESMDNADSYIY